MSIVDDVTEQVKAAMKAKDQPGTVKWLMLTILGGLIFLGIQAYEYTHLVHAGIGFSTSTFAGTLLYFSTAGTQGLRPR